ncbi:MAG: HlyD family efflux transporter periplasmic adaptor subunit [Paracoccaceae bacterium]|jgi:multidrug resistance efflux pump|nr:HlyD family efflux transporter periplasmic adaptor subunit [Paracoccaceae bacterium]
MQFLRRALTGLFLLSLTLGLFALAGASFWGAVQERIAREAPERPARERVMAVNAVTVEARTLTPVMTVFGEVRSRRTLEVRASADGRVVELAPAFEDGARVEAGTVLARIDPTEAEAALDVARTDLAEAKAELRDAERSLGLARDELAAARAQRDLRARALTRQQDLSERGVGTTAAAEEAELALSSAEQAVLTRRISEANAESRLDQARNALSRARIALEEAEREVADTEIRAAFSGTLADVTLTEGGLVTQNEQIATLIDDTALEAAFRVSTAQYARLIDDAGSLIAAPVRVRLDALGLDLESRGAITRVGAAVGEGETGRRLFARLDDAAGFRPGDFVSVMIDEPALDGVALLPATAVDSAGTVLVIGADDRLRVEAAPILRRQGDEVIVPAAGLAGEKVVAERTPLLGPGIKVRDLSARQSQAGAEGGPERVENASAGRIALSPERRAALRAAVEGNAGLPEAARARLLAQLEAETVPAELVARIEARMGG